MIRKAFFALMAVLTLVASSQAGIVISVEKQATPELAGYETHILTATSDVAGEFISVVDFIGDKDNTDPNTARGFFGPMNQLMAGPSTTVFSDFNFVFPQPLQDSQFRVASNTVTVPSGFAIEGPNFLRATYAYGEPSAQSLQFAQLAVPIAQTAAVNYRGAFSVTRGGTVVDLPELTGCVGTCGDPGVAPSVADVAGETSALGDVIMLMPMDSVPGTPPVNWSTLSGPTYTKDFGASDDAFGLGTATWSWDPGTQKFQFNTLGSTRGRYVWTGTASNDTGSDPFSITVDVKHVPEPATLALVGLALVGFVGVARKRS